MPEKPKAQGPALCDGIRCHTITRTGWLSKKQHNITCPPKLTLVTFDNISAAAKKARDLGA